MASASASAPSTLDRPLARSRNEVSLSAFAFLFAEIVQSAQTRSASVSDLEKRLEECGYGVGARRSPPRVAAPGADAPSVFESFVVP